MVVAFVVEASIVEVFVEPLTSGVLVALVLVAEVPVYDAPVDVAAEVVALYDEPVEIEVEVAAGAGFEIVFETGLVTGVDVVLVVVDAAGALGTTVVVVYTFGFISVVVALVAGAGVAAGVIGDVIEGLRLNHWATAATPSCHELYVLVALPVLPTFPGLIVLTATPAVPKFDSSSR